MKNQLKIGNVKVQKKFILVSVLALLILLSIEPAMAAPSVTTRGNAYGMGYDQTIGVLGGANYVVRIPDQWNGMLIVGCHPYNHANDANPQFQLDPLAFVFVAKGYAYAASDFGATGYCVQDAVIRTHQLTEYVVNNYDVTGKIFIVGGSMGGQVALLLGEKYPTLYSGVLDICGPKDMSLSYNGALTIASSSLSQIRAIFGWPAIVPDATVQGLKDFCTSFVNDIKAETGGTPETKLKAYERISPVDHADIAIPVISLVGGADILVPLSQTIEYQNSIAATGNSALYKMIVVPTGGHLDAITLANAPDALSQLITWSNIINP